jgi:hypothetical protein
VLCKQGRRTGTGLTFTKTRVASLRFSRGIPAFQPKLDVTASDHDVEVVSKAQAALDAWFDWLASRGEL